MLQKKLRGEKTNKNTMDSNNPPTYILQHSCLSKNIHTITVKLKVVIIQIGVILLIILFLITEAALSFWVNTLVLVACIWDEFAGWHAFEMNLQDGMVACIWDEFLSFKSSDQFPFSLQIWTTQLMFSKFCSLVKPCVNKICQLIETRIWMVRQFYKYIHTCLWIYACDPFAGMAIHMYIIACTVQSAGPFY